MTREDDVLVERDIELPRPAGDKFKLTQSFGFQPGLRTEGPFLIASRLAVVDTNFHFGILPDNTDSRNPCFSRMAGLA